MRTGWTIALIACGAAVGGARLRAPRGVRAEPSATYVLAPAADTALTAIDQRMERVAEPLPAADLPLGPILAATPETLLETPRHVDAAEAERIARRAFHAQVNVEELDAALPREEFEARTPERFPGYFAALAERDALSVELAQLPAPGRDQNLPVLDLRAESSDDFARIYRGWTREDLLVENWRISRAARAESSRALAERLTNGPYDTKPIGQLFTMG